MRVVISSVVFDLLVAPDIRNSSKNTSQSKWNGVGIGHFGYKNEHEERSGIEVSDWDLDLL